MDLVLTSIQNEFKKLDDENCAFLLIETIENGLFFDTLELYLGIMKERIDKKKEGINMAEPFVKKTYYAMIA